MTFALKLHGQEDAAGRKEVMRQPTILRTRQADCSRKQTMIISHKYRFIFLKTKKTAGTSIEIALSRVCGEEDIITPISPEDEDVRRDLGYRGAQKHLSPMWDYGFRDVARLLIRRKKKLRYYNHISAREVRRLIGEGTWNDYYKFCFERNPWDRVISFYYWQYKSEPRPSISEFLDSDMPLMLKKKGFELYTIDGKVVVNRVCLFENLKEELERIRVQLGLTEELVLPKSKSSFRKDKRSYREILDEKQKEKIRNLFSEEIALYGYEF